MRKKQLHAYENINYIKNMNTLRGFGTIIIILGPKPGVKRHILTNFRAKSVLKIPKFA